MGFSHTDLDEKIKELLEIDEITPLIKNQIGRFITEKRMTYLEIARALAYFIVVKNGDIKPEMGIGIVPYVLNDSKKYFKDLEERTKAQRADSEEFQKKKTSSYDIECKKLKKINRQKTLIDLDSINFGEDDNE